MKWEVKRLDELVSDFITKGATPTTTGHDWVESGIPFLRSECVSANGFELNGIRYITPAANAQLARSVVRPGDLLISITGNVGRVVRYPATMPPGNINQHIARVRIERDDVLPDFVVYQLLTPEQQDRFGSIHVGAAYPLLSLKQIRETAVRIPPLPEQQRIVSKLDAAFRALREAEGNVERNRTNARELFESYLNGVFEGKGWPMKRLKAVSLDFGRGKSKHRPRNDKKLYGGEYPFVQTGDVRNSEHFITEYTQTYNDFGLAQSKLWPKGTLCITIAANIAETAILDFDGCFPDSVIGMVADPKQCNIHYVEYLLQSFKTVLQAQGKGSAQDNLNLATFEKQTFPFPSLQDQQIIATALDQLSSRARHLSTAYEQKLQELGALKKSLLAAAFRGEL